MACSDRRFAPLIDVDRGPRVQADCERMTHPEVGFAPRLAPDLGYDGLSHPAKLVADGSAKRSQE